MRWQRGRRPRRGGRGGDFFFFLSKSRRQIGAQNLIKVRHVGGESKRAGGVVPRLEVCLSHAVRGPSPLPPTSLFFLPPSFSVSSNARGLSRGWARRGVFGCSLTSAVHLNKLVKASGERCEQTVQGIARARRHERVQEEGWTAEDADSRLARNGATTLVTALGRFYTHREGS